MKILRKFFIQSLLLLTFPALSLAFPYLLCEPYDVAYQPIFFRVLIVETSVTTDTPYALDPSGNPIVIDLSGIPNSAWTLNIKTCNNDGCSISKIVRIPAVPGGATRYKTGSKAFRLIN